MDHTLLAMPCAPSFKKSKQTIGDALACDDAYLFVCVCVCVCVCLFVGGIEDHGQ